MEIVGEERVGLQQSLTRSPRGMRTVVDAKEMAVLGSPDRTAHLGGEDW